MALVPTADELSCGRWVWFRSVNNKGHLESKVRLHLYLGF